MWIITQFTESVWSKTSPQTSMYISGNFITVNLPKSVLFLVDSLENRVRNEQGCGVKMAKKYFIIFYFSNRVVPLTCCLTCLFLFFLCLLLLKEELICIVFCRNIIQYNIIKIMCVCVCVSVCVCVCVCVYIRIYIYIYIYSYLYIV